MEYIKLDLKGLDKEAENLKSRYIAAEPFPHIVIDDFFNEKNLDLLIENFPKNLGEFNSKFDNFAEKKLALNNPSQLSKTTNDFINFLNSYIFINFLQKITGIKETLLPDPYLIGGGLHELRNGGFLNIHADFNIHPRLQLDRRLNLLIYLNKDWNDDNGGQLELWDKDMKKCFKSILPKFNRMVIFSTTSFSNHGNPNKVKCENNSSRKSLALYYYSNGRPENEVMSQNHATIFKKRPNSDDKNPYEFKKIFGKFYVRTRK